MSTIPFNTYKTQPQLKDLLDVLKRDILLTLNCHHVATINSFNSTSQTIEASINYCRTVVDSSGNETTVNYPLIADVPVVSLCGGNSYLSFPVSKGDQALILFNDRDLDNWIEGARSGQLNSTRLHAFSDGIALVGLNQISSFDAIRALLSNGTVKLGINPSSNKVTIQTQSVTLGSVLTNLVSALSTFFSSASSATTAPQIATAAGIASSSLSSNAVATKITELLE